MRFTEAEASIITTAIKTRFGSVARIILFALGDRKIDMVLANPEGDAADLLDPRPIVRISRATGIAL